MTLRKLVTQSIANGVHRNFSNKWCLPSHSIRTKVNKIQTVPEFEEYVNGSVKLLVIDYKADWCGPCKRMSPLFEGLSDQYDDKCDFLCVDCDDLPELAAQRGVASLPTFELIRNGKALEQVIGANPSKLEQAIVRNLEE